MKLSETFEVMQSAQVDMGERIRDLEMLRNGDLLATTDSGKLITISNRTS
jgi:glucose/arabinose dehydrogenase